MKYIKLFEKFTKEYQTQIELKDFKKIKKGSMIQYMGGAVEVLDNNGYVLKLKDDDGKIFTVNKSQFDHGGRISEVSDGKKKEKEEEFHTDVMYEAEDYKYKKYVSKAFDTINDEMFKFRHSLGIKTLTNKDMKLKKKVEVLANVIFDLEKEMKADGLSESVVTEAVNELKRTLVSGTMSGSTESLEDRKYELKKDAKGATIGNFSNVTLPKGTIIYNLPGGVFADHFSLKNKYSSRSSQGPQYFDKPTFKGIMIKQTPAVLSYIEKNSKVLESFDTEINEAKDNLYLQLHKKYAEQIKGLKAKKIKKLTDLVSVQRRSMEDREDYFDMDPKKKKELTAEYAEERKLFKKYMGRDYSVMLPKGTESLRESSAKDGGDKSNGNSHHDDHTDNTVAQHWKDIYGEEFHSKYPAVAKIVKQRNIKDKRELKRIWDETYGENFEEQYPALYNKLD
tara:strand:+ start:2362 stop:3714 length:1353 start_codon:yes stop_codon:yes gene_type:complete